MRRFLVSLLLLVAGVSAASGEAPADLPAICRCLMGAGQIGLDWEAVTEIDINPVLISTDGRVKAVDALIVLRS